MRNPTSAEVAAEVRAALARKGESRQWLADETGIDRSGLSRRLAGTREFSVAEILRVADALEIDAAQLLPSSTQAAS